MMDERDHEQFKPKGLARLGLFFDDLGKLRVLDPEVQTSAQQLAIDCNEFISESQMFQEVVKEFTSVIKTLSEAIEATVIQALGSRNSLDTMSKQKRMRRQQLEARVAEKNRELEHLRVQYESLVRQDAQLQDLIITLGSASR